MNSMAGSCESPTDLTCVLKKVRAALEGRKHQSLQCHTLEVGEDGDGGQRDAGGNLDDVKEAFGACQTIEWKEQEYRYLRSKVIGHRRRDIVNGSTSRDLGGSTIPAVHKILLRSLSTPDAPQMETRNYKTFLRHRRASLALECRPPGSCNCAARDGKTWRRSETTAKEKVPVESEPDDLYESPSLACAKIVSYVKSNAWASRESLLSAASRSIGSSEEDNTSVILNPSLVIDASDNAALGKSGVPRSVSEETLIYRYDNPAEARSGGGEGEVPTPSSNIIVGEVPVPASTTSLHEVLVVASTTSVGEVFVPTSTTSEGVAPVPTTITSEGGAPVPASTTSEGGAPVPASTTSEGGAPVPASTTSEGEVPVVASTTSVGEVPALASTTSLHEVPAAVSTTSEGGVSASFSCISEGGTPVLASTTSESGAPVPASTTSEGGAPQAASDISHSYIATSASLTDDPGGTTTLAASVASILDSIPHIDSDSDEDNENDGANSEPDVDCEAAVICVTAAKITHCYPPELPPLCEPEEDLCSSGEDWHLVQTQEPALLPHTEHVHNEGAFVGVGAPSLCPKYSAACVGVDSPSPFPGHTYEQFKIHVQSQPIQVESQPIQVQSQSSIYVQSHPSIYDQSHPSVHVQSQSIHVRSQSPSHSQEQSYNHAYSQCSSHALGHARVEEMGEGWRGEAPGKAAAALTGGYSNDGSAVVEVFMGVCGEAWAWLARCCDPAHPYALPLPPTPPRPSHHHPLLVLLPLQVLHLSPHLLHALKKLSWVRVWVVMPSLPPLSPTPPSATITAPPVTTTAPPTAVPATTTALPTVVPVTTTAAPAATVPATATALPTAVPVTTTAAPAATVPATTAVPTTTTAPPTAVPATATVALTTHVQELLSHNALQLEVVSEEELHRRVPRDQLSSQFGGTLVFNHHAWFAFCKMRETLLDVVRACATTLERCILQHQPSSPPPSPPPLPSHYSNGLSSSSSSYSPASHCLAPASSGDVEAACQYTHNARAYLREMEKWYQRLHEHILVKSWLTQCQHLVDTVDSLTRLLLTQEHTQSSRHCHLYHEANTVVAWLLGRGEETLARHQTLADTLTGITRQQTEFLKFHSVAMRHLEKGGALLEEAASAGDTEASVKELARALHLHLTQFTDRLHHTRDRLQDTATCYHLLDKAYEWALEAMKVVGRVKGEGLASPEQVGAAARALTAHLEEHPPIPEDNFTAMTTLATRLNNHTLLQQCKMAQVRCQETHELLRNRQAALHKAKRQMEFDCQSFVDLGEVFGGGEEMSPLAWLACSPLNVSGRRRSVSSVGSRPREALSRCPSLDTDDDSVFLDPPPPPPPAKTPLEPRTSLGGIKEVRESAEDLQQPSPLPSPTTAKLTSTASGITTSSSGSSGTCGSSSCSSSESSGPVSVNKKFMKRANTWQYGLIPKEHTDESSGMDDGVPLSPTSHKSIPPSSAVNSHLLIRGSQLNLSINTDDLSQEEVKKSKTLLLIMRELIQTERDYVNSLEYIIENYIPELMREDIPQALRGQRNVVFGNIEKIYEFHSGYFLHALEACEMRPFAVGSIFLRYESQFYLYALYNKNKPKSDSLMSEYGSAFFRKKQLELEDRMDLASYLLKPVQRMGKYALILKQLLKECGRGEENYDDLLGAQEMVQFQLRHGNDLLAMDSLRDCDVNLKEQGRLLRQGEFVVWEGSRAKKSVRHVFLFEDLILFSKARRDPEKKTLDIFQYKHSMKMTDIGLTEQVSVSTTKFEIWFRKRKPSDTYLLQAANAEMKEAWTEEISKLLWRQALRNRTMRLHEMSSMGIGNKPCLDIRPSEDQISDRSISINQLNKAPRLRTGSTSTVGDLNGGVGKRPHSIISVSSSSASSSASSASSTHSSAVCPTYVGALNLGFEAGDSPRALHRSVTRTSQCSAESGILADMYSGGDDDSQSHRRVERSNSTVTTVSVDSALSPASSVSPTSPVSPVSPLAPSLIAVPPTRATDVIYEAPSVTPTSKDSSAKTLLTTEV